jgi:hypothetical protein
MRKCWVFALAPVVMAAAGEARADRAHAAEWIIDVEGDGCDAHRATFEREVALACGAVGTCRLAPTLQNAELRATLVCKDPGDPSLLKTATVEGADLGSVELAGAPQDRVREAAVEIARDAAPERTLATQTLRNSLATADRPAPLVPVTPSPRFSIGMGATGAVEYARATAGARLLGALRVSSTAYTTLSVAGALGGTEESAVRRLRGGPGIGLGAPFIPTKVVGIMAEIGADVMQSYPDSWGSKVLSPQTRTAGYGQTTVFLQVPNNKFRPYGALSMTLFTVQPIIAAGLELGLTLPVF